MDFHSPLTSRTGSPISFVSVRTLALLGVALLALAFGLSVPNADAATKYIDNWGQAAALDGPYDSAIDSEGNVYVTDTKNNRIQKFNSKGILLTKWGKPGGLDGEFNSPVGIAIDSSDRVYVVDSFNNRVQVFDSQGNFKLKWGGPGNQDGKFLNPEGIAIDKQGRVYVADTINQRIQVFTPEGGFIGKWGTPGQGDGQFLAPRSIAISPEGDIYVVEATNNRVQKFAWENNTGVFKAKWGSNGQKAGQFLNPAGIEVAPDGSVIVSDTGNNRIQRFDGSGNFIETWGGKGVGPGQFDQPIGIVAGKDDGIYIANTTNDRIEVYAFEPAAPVLQSTDPASPAVSLKPHVRGIASPSTLVQIFTSPDCSGDPVGEGTGADLSSTNGIEVSVLAGSMNSFRARAKNTKFNLTTPCTPSALTYKHVLPPPAPTELKVSPDSPGTSLTPTVTGKAVFAEADTVSLYKTADCSGPPVASGTVEAFGKEGFQVAVEKGSSTTFRATATSSVYKQTSACSGSFVTYVQKDPVIPPPPPPPPDPCLTTPKPESCPDDEQPPVPTLTTATFDGVNLHVLLRCPARFKPKCVSNAAPVTALGFKKVRRAGKTVKIPKGKPMANAKKVTIASNRWVKVSFAIKPAFRSKVEAMATVDAKRLFVRQVIRSKRIGKKPNRKSQTVFHTYKVRK